MSSKSIIKKYISNLATNYQKLIYILFIIKLFLFFLLLQSKSSTSNNNNNNNNNNNANTSTNGLNHSSQSKNSSLLKPSNQPDTNLSMKPTTAPSHASKLNKGKSQNRSKGKSTVNQTVSPPLRVDQVARPMSVSPLPKEAAKLSSPNNCSFALTTSPQNNHNSNILCHQ